MTKSDFSCVETRFFPGSRHCASVLQPQVPKLGTDLDLSLLYILILKFTRKNNFPARRLLSASPARPQVCRVKLTFTNLPTNRFVCTTKISMKCVVNWIPLRIRVRSRNTQPHLKSVCVCVVWLCVPLILNVTARTCRRTNCPRMY